MVAPIFLLSLPRSGSTLLQRLLASHPAIHTASEPWFLLPLLFTLKDGGVRACYGHRWLRVAVDDFARELPRGRHDYVAALRGCAELLYTRASPPATRYFVDKTPRYHLVVDELREAFPEARFVFLWRHPLAVAASIMETWARPRGSWNLFRSRIDLYQGLANLARARQVDPASPAVQYETLVREPGATLERLWRDLGLEPPSDPDGCRVALRGRLGDRRAAAETRDPSPASLDRWQHTMANPLRRRWCRRYVRWIGSERLARMGYDADRLLAEVEAMPTTLRHVGSDLLRGAYGRLHGRFRIDPASALAGRI